MRMLPRELLRMPPGAKRAAAGLPVLRRLRDALARPPHPNMYVAPRLRTLDAVAYALRGYRVRWTEPVEPMSGVWESSVLVYEVEPESGFRFPVELSTLLPGELHRVASWVQSARTIGIRFAVWQARRELPLVLQRRKREADGQWGGPWA